jgi:hypothetical protein
MDVQPHHVSFFLLRFSSIILVVSFKIATHTRFWSWLMFVSLLCLSICLYVAYMWISNVLTGVKGTVTMVYSTLECYLCVLFCVAVLLIIDGLLIFLEFWKGGYASKMRRVISDDRISNKSFYDQLSLKATELNVRHK